MMVGSNPATRPPCRAIVTPVLVTMLLVLSACGTSGGDGASAPATEGAPASEAAESQVASAAPLMPETMTPINVGLASGLVISPYWDFMIAQELGFFEQNNLEPEFVSFPNPGATTQAAAGGSVDFMAAVADTQVLAIDSGAPLKIIAGQSLAVAALVVAPEITSFEDLRGGTIGATGPASGTTISTIHLLDSKVPGLSEEVDIIDAGPTAERFAALQSGSVDGAVVAPPVVFLAQDEGYRLLGYTHEGVGEYTQTVHAVNTDFAANNHAAVVAYVRAISSAALWLYDPANQDEAIEVLRTYTEVDLETATKTYDLIVSELGSMSRDGRVPAEAFQNMLNLLAETQSDFTGATEPDKFKTDEYWEEASR
jgi:NitT/TauT family transport system substrate-binding protein